MTQKFIEITTISHQEECYTVFTLPSGTISITHKSHFPSFITKDILLHSGKWFYEITIIKNGLIQMGWATKHFNPTDPRDGVGDDNDSFAYDGRRKLKWGQGAIHEEYGKEWKSGDVIGAMIDLDDKKIEFTLNGINLGVAFKNINTNGGMYPAFSMSYGSEVEVNFGSDLIKFPATDYIPVHNVLNKFTTSN